ncbi:ATP-binding cassette domain-containing protein [Thermosphaera chiliense]|uniref:ATP-binding cassette domain-containing protein n=1 Tax=Thermosphaera chiliense TaxID=3402707 RepID=A0A7M1UQU1_9CREN|nr:ATP-binding cassette domain-containing protein [Thermosphaera aggregans]QOR94349.1 ATP-binding cassette domain-containing protein [Thermosphaera aggregans]
MPDLAVEIKGFTKRFGETVAVDNLTMDIYDGEIFGLLGPNGSGKTTTLLTIATVYKPTSGDILVYGHSVVREDYVVRKLIGIAFQEPKAMWVDKPWDLLTWHAKISGYSSSDARRVVREVMEELGLWEHRNKYFYQLSGGTRKKVELAKVLIQRPRLAILDEPTAQVDVITKHVLWDIIKKMRKQGTTMIVATNDMFEAEKVCERIGIIYRGRLRKVGSIEELKDAIPGGDILEISVEEHGLAEAVVEELSVYGRVEVRGDVLRIYMNKGEEKSLEILEYFRKRNIGVKRIMIKEPTLDDVFMYVTGAKLRE